MASPALLAEQAGLQHQPAGHQAVAKIQQQIQIAATAVIQQQSVPLQAVQQGLLIQAFQLAAQVIQAGVEPASTAVHASQLPAEQAVSYTHLTLPTT